MVQWNTRVYHTSELEWTAEHCCICIPGRACVEHFVDLLAPPPTTPCGHPFQGSFVGPVLKTQKC